jgi:membrane-associated protease RseP (regulator of RpoE activity)
MLYLGDSLLFSWLIQLVLGVHPTEAMIVLHPIAWAGWFGLLLTSINLLPIGQLDGGHIAYAVFGRHHRWIARGTITFLLVLAIGVWRPWVVPILMFMFLGLGHPPPWDTFTTLDRKRVVAATLTLLVLIVTFVPVPAEIIEPLPRFEGEAIPVSAPENIPSHGLVYRL